MARLLRVYFNAMFGALAWHLALWFSFVSTAEVHGGGDGRFGERVLISERAGSHRIVFSSGGEFIAADSFDAAKREALVRVWRVKDGEEVAQLQGDPSDARSYIQFAFSPDGRYFALPTFRRESDKGTSWIWLWETKTWTVARKFQIRGNVLSMSFCLDGTAIWLPQEEGRFRFACMTSSQRKNCGYSKALRIAWSRCVFHPRATCSLPRTREIIALR